MTKDDGEGLRVIRKDDVWWKIQQFKGIHPKTLHWASLGSTGLDSKNDFFVQGCSHIMSSILNHQGVAYKVTTGWHNHQGVSETPKTYDIIYEQPLKYASVCFRLLQSLLSASALPLNQSADTLSSNQNKVDHRKWNFNVIFTLADF